MKTELIKTEAQLNALGSKELVEHYNDLAQELDLHPVRRFADKPTGVKRTLVLVNQYKKATKAEEKAAPTPAAKAPKAPKKANVKSEDAEAKASARRGTNLQPIGYELQACREGTKQAILLDQLCRPEGATMDELIEALSGGNKPWTEATVRSGFGWDLKNKGYGVRSEFVDGVERFFIVVPAKFPKIPAHTPLKSAKPKAHAAQQRLA